jgi:hypothetical protein
MNGAIAEPSVRMISAPSRIRKMMIGASHHFFRVFRKLQNSERIDIFDIALPPLLQYCFDVRRGLTAGTFDAISPAHRFAL